MSLYLATSAPALIHFLATTKKTSSSPLPFILIIVLLGVFLLMRSQRSKQRQAQVATQQSIEVGDEVVTTSGIVGRVVALNEDRATISIAPDTHIEIVRAALGRRVPPATIEPADDYDHDGYGHDGYGHDEHEPTGGDDPKEGSS